MPDSMPQHASYSGHVTFMRRPVSEDFAAADVVVSGVPFDVATTNRPGARFGPRAIREQSLQLAWGPIWPWGYDPFDRLNVIDFGDVHWDWGRPQDMASAVTEHTARVLEAGAVPVTLGGDHFATLSLLRAVAEKHGPVALVHFDAHRDVEPDEGGERMDHGAVFTNALREGLIIEEASVQIGVRTMFAGEGGANMTVLNAAQIHEALPEQAAAAIRQTIGDRPCYLTFDIDCLDPAFAPGTGTPVPGGLTTHQARAILWNLRGLNFIGFDIMEVSPPYDPAGITALAGATLALDFCCLLAAGKGS